MLAVLLDKFLSTSQEIQAELKAVEAELGTVDDDLAQFFTGVRYRAVAGGVVRAG